ncbi:MAG TPA: M56 family metallopeptidase, partial [Flavobacterium sp.]|nr:M56 family metallopeptidase [Flavobacterium sp.]
YTLVELASEHSAFSFFNILFIHPDMAKSSTVLKHEIIHIKQKHSWDIILLELLKICCWFNPVVYLMKKDLTLLHEYIADEKTTAANISKHEYAMFLIENSMAAYSSSLVNQLFNQSILKSRINMLNKEKTANWARLKYLLAVPLGVGLLCASTLGFSKSYGYFEIGHQSVQQKKVTKSKQEKKSYYPDSKFDKDNNFVSLEKRAIIINGQVIADKNKYYGAAEADDIKYLGSTEAIKKYGSKIGKDGAVEITGKDVVMTPPPPAMPQASTSKPPKVKQDQVKFPPPRVKRDAKETPPLSPTPNKIKKDQVKFPPPIVKPDKKVSTANKAKLMEEIEIVEEKLVKKQEKLDLKLNKVEEVKVEKINKSEDEPAPKQKMEELRIVPAKKAQTLKLVPKDKTTAIEKRENYQTKEITTVKISTPKTSNIFSKAWTLYKPKPKEDKNDQC